MGRKADYQSDEKTADVDPDFIYAAHSESWTAKFHRIASKFQIEQRGIERVPEGERTDTSGVVNVGTMWLATNMVVSSFAIGALATPVFNLGFVDTILTIFFTNLLAIIPVAFFSTFGLVFGLRQMVLSRYYFGFHGVKFIAVLNILSCIGWSCVITIVGGQLLHAVNSSIPGYCGILIIAVGTFFVTLFGYNTLHTYEFWSWIPSFIVFLIVLGEFAHSDAFVNLPMGIGTSEAASVLSFAASIFGYAAGWTSCAADYTCYQPTFVSRLRVFFSTFAGLAFPLLFTQSLGAAVMTASLSTPAYTTGYADAGIGGLLGAVLFPPLGGFGRFCMVILALSIVANNCPCVYSVGLSIQVLAGWTARVPRALWTFLATLAYLAISIPGYSHFESVIENLMLMIAYWLAIYIGIAVTEHVVFKRGLKGYDVRIYAKPALLPPGIAAMAAFAVGVGGAVLGMSQVWFVGPVGRKVGGRFGGDVGFEMGFGCAGLAYVAFRTVERRVFGR